MSDRDHDISTLNSLIATTLDSVQGYEEAAKDAEGGRFGSLFLARANERRQVASNLQSEVRGWAVSRAKAAPRLAARTASSST